MKEYGLDERSLLLLHHPKGAPPSLDSVQVHGRSVSEAREIAQSADLLWNYTSSLQEPLLSLFKRRVLIDLDPAIWQVSVALDLELGHRTHHVFLTAGSKSSHPTCYFPTAPLPPRPSPPT